METVRVCARARVHACVGCKDPWSMAFKLRWGLWPSEKVPNLAKDQSLTQKRDLKGALEFHQAEEKCQIKATSKLASNCLVYFSPRQIESLLVLKNLYAQEPLPTKIKQHWLLYQCWLLGQGICVQQVLGAHPLIIDIWVTELMFIDIWPVKTGPFQVLLKLVARFAAQQSEAVKPPSLAAPFSSFFSQIQACWAGWHWVWVSASWFPLHLNKVIKSAATDFILLALSPTIWFCSAHAIVGAREMGHGIFTSLWSLLICEVQPDLHVVDFITSELIFSGDGSLKLHLGPRFEPCSTGWWCPWWWKPNARKKLNVCVFFVLFLNTADD